MDSQSESLVPADCPAEVALEYGSSDVVDYRLPEITKKVQSRWK